MPNRTPSRVLLVEGKSEMFALPFLLEANGVPWPRNAPPVFIKETNGIDELLKPGLIEAEVKRSGLVALGIVADADDKFTARWTDIRAACNSVAPHIDSGDLTSDGLVTKADNGLPFGLWIMPDNTSSGMFETFLAALRKNVHSSQWAYAESVVDEAKRSHGAAFSKAHRDKARLHTYLSWQDPPGRTLQEAVRDQVLDPLSPTAASFVAWFRRLFGV